LERTTNRTAPPRTRLAASSAVGEIFSQWASQSDAVVVAQTEPLVMFSTAVNRAFWRPIPWAM
jgi:hypothetical protein